MTKTELQTALIEAGWEMELINYYVKNNSELSLYGTFFNYDAKVFPDYSDCRLIEVPMKDGTIYRAIVCDIDGLFLRLEL